MLFRFAEAVEDLQKRLRVLCAQLETVEGRMRWVSMRDSDLIRYWFVLQTLLNPFLQL